MEGNPERSSGNDITGWFNSNIANKQWTKPDGSNIYFEKIDSSNSPTSSNKSSFNDERYDVIQSSIKANLIQAMHNYGFQMPEFSGDEWERISNNVCCISFMQGIPVGTTVFNDYAIAVSTENQEMVKESDIYFKGDGDSSYHRIWCPHLTGNIKGQYKTAYNGTQACYYCVVRASDSTIEYAKAFDDKYHLAGYNYNARKSSYYSAINSAKIELANKKSLFYVNGSDGL